MPMIHIFTGHALGSTQPVQKDNQKTIPKPSSVPLLSKKWGSFADVAQFGLTGALVAHSDWFGKGMVASPMAEPEAQRGLHSVSQDSFHSTKTSHSKQTDSPESGNASDVEGAAEIEIVDEMPREPQDSLYFRYLMALSDDDILSRKEVAKQNIRRLDRYLSNSDPDRDPDFRRYSQKLRKNEAELELARAVFYLRDIADGHKPPLSAEEKEKLSKEILEDLDQIDAYSYHQPEPNIMTEGTLRFLTQGHPNEYYQYIQCHSDQNLQERRATYADAFEKAKEDFFKTSHARKDELTEYEGFKAKPPKSSSPKKWIADLLKPKGRTKTPTLAETGAHRDTVPIQGWSLNAHGGEGVEHLKAWANYEAEKYLAEAEIHRRQVNRGLRDIPTPALVNNILDSIDEYATDVIMDYKLEPVSGKKGKK